MPTNIQKLILYPDYLEIAQSGFQVLYMRKCDKLNPYIKISTDCIMCNYYPKTILAASYYRIQYELKFHD